MNRLPPECPIQCGAHRLSELSEDMILTLRQLRQDLKNCPKCPAYWDCPILTNLNNNVQTAIQEVVDEWNLQRLVLKAHDED